MFASVILESVTLCVLAGEISELVVRADLVQVTLSVIPTLCAPEYSLGHESGIKVVRHVRQ